MRRVIVESPYAGDVKRNEIYARAAMLDCLRRGEAPFVSHLFYTQVLDDTILEDRVLGIGAGHAWIICADATVVYTDLGISPGMKEGIAIAENHRRVIEYRTLEKGA